MTEQEYKDRLKRLIDLLPMNNASSVNNYWKVKEWADEGFHISEKGLAPFISINIPFSIALRMEAANEIYSREIRKLKNGSR